MIAPLALAAVLAATPPPPRVEVRIEPARIRVGDLATVHLAVGPTAEAPVFPEWGERWGGSEVRKVEAPVRQADGSWAQRLQVTAFRPGPLELPAPEVVVAGARIAASAGVRLDVQSVLPEKPEEATLQPPAPPVALPWPAAFWWLAALLTALGVATAALLLDRSRRERPAAALEPALPPLAELLAALGGLGAEAPERAHAGLSLALRRFLGRSFGFPATESTTTEIQRALAARRLEQAVARRTVQLLRDCDQVKFAGRGATAGELAARIELARETAARVEAALRPAAAGEAPA